MAEKKEYRSSVRSRRMIRQAFLALLEEKPFEKITITDIVTRADLNRSTFYAHYPDVRGVVEEMQDEIFQENIRMLEQLDFAEFLRDPMPYVSGISELLGKNIRLFQRLGHTEDLHIRLDNFRRVMVEDICRHKDLPAELRDSPIAAIRIYFFIGGIMNTYQQWAEGVLTCSLDDITREVAEMIRSCAGNFLPPQG